MYYLLVSVIREMIEQIETNCLIVVIVDEVLLNWFVDFYISTNYLLSSIKMLSYLRIAVNLIFIMVKLRI